MMEHLPAYTTRTSFQSILDSISRTDPKVVISLGGMLCLTAMFCVDSVISSGYELELSSKGLYIRHPSETNEDSY